MDSAWYPVVSVCCGDDDGPLVPQQCRTELWFFVKYTVLDS